MGSKLEKTKRKQSKERKVMKEEEEEGKEGSMGFYFWEREQRRETQKGIDICRWPGRRSLSRQAWRGRVGSRSVALAAAAAPAATAAVGGN